VIDVLKKERKKEVESIVFWRKEFKYLKARKQLFIVKLLILFAFCLKTTDCYDFSLSHFDYSIIPNHFY